MGLPVPFPPPPKKNTLTLGSSLWPQGGWNSSLPAREGTEADPARSEPVVLRARALRRARSLGGGGRAPGGPADAPGAEEAVAALTLLPSFLP